LINRNWSIVCDWSNTIRQFANSPIRQFANSPIRQLTNPNYQLRNHPITRFC
jgi:hypothetical protein